MKITYLEENEFFSGPFIGIGIKGIRPVGSWLIDFINKDLTSSNLSSKYFTIDVQFRYRKLVDWCLAISPNNEKLKTYSSSQRFYLYLVLVTEYSINSLPKKVDITYMPNPINPDFISDSKTNINSDEAFVFAKNNIFSLSEIYELDNNDITSVCYIEFTQMIRKNTNVRQCKYCNKYFIVTGRTDTEYCTDCKETGAKKVYQDKVKDNEYLTLYQREYQRLYAKIRYTAEPLKTTKRKILTAWVEMITLKIKENNMDIVIFSKWLKNEGKKVENEFQSTY